MKNSPGVLLLSLILLSAFNLTAMAGTSPTFEEAQCDKKEDSSKDYEEEGDYSYTEDNYGKVKIMVKMSGKQTAKELMKTMFQSYNMAVKQIGEKELRVSYKCKRSLLNKRISMNTKILSLDEFLSKASEEIGVNIVRDGSKVTISNKK